MVFKHAKEGRSRRMFLSALLTSADKQLPLAALRNFTSCFCHGLGGAQRLPCRAVARGCKVQKRSKGCRPMGTDAAKRTQWVSNNHEVAFPPFLPQQVLNIRAHCQMTQEGKCPGPSRLGRDAEAGRPRASDTHQSLL